MLFVRNKKGQSAAEFTMLFIILIGAFLATQNYLKRGVQGRWKAHIDELGDQYDPRVADTNLRETMNATTNTVIITMNMDGGYWTRRTDESNSTQERTGYTGVGGY